MLQNTRKRTMSNVKRTMPSTNLRFADDIVSLPRVRQSRASFDPNFQYIKSRVIISDLLREKSTPYMWSYMVPLKWNDIWFP